MLNSAILAFDGQSRFPTPSCAPLGSQDTWNGPKGIPILITSVDRTIGQSIAKILRRTEGLDPVIVGVSPFRSAAGQVWCNAFYYNLSLTGDIERARHDLKKISILEQIQIIFAGTEADLTVLNLDADFFKEQRIQVVLNSPGVLEMGVDKWQFYRTLLSKGVDARLIPTELFARQTYGSLREKLGGAFVLKPRISSGARGIFPILDEQTYHNVTTYNRLSNYMAQTIIGKFDIMRSDEYTASAFGFGDGTFNNLITLRRNLSSDGHTQYGTVADSPQVAQIMNAICRAIMPMGPTNIQFIVDSDSLFILEMNPKISASTSMRFLFGVNEPANCIQWYLLRRKPLQAKVEGGVAIKFLEDMVYQTVQSVH